MFRRHTENRQTALLSSPSTPALAPSPISGDLPVCQRPLVQTRAARVHIVFSSILLSHVMRAGLYEGKEFIPVTKRLSWFFLLVIAVYILVFYVFELYDIKEKFLKLRALLTITLAVSSAAAMLSGLFYFFPEYGLGRMVLAIHMPIAVIGLFFWRLSFLRTLHKERRPLRQVM